MSRRTNQNRKSGPLNSEDGPVLQDSELNAIYGVRNGVEMFGEELRLLESLRQFLHCGGNFPISKDALVFAFEKGRLRLVAEKIDGVTKQKEVLSAAAADAINENDAKHYREARKKFFELAERAIAENNATFFQRIAEAMKVGPSAWQAEPADGLARDLLENYNCCRRLLSLRSPNSRPTFVQLMKFCSDVGSPHFTNSSHSETRLREISRGMGLKFARKKRKEPHS